MPHRHSCHIHQHRHSCRIHHVPHTQGVLDRDTGGEMVLNTKPLTNTSFFKTTTLKSTVTTNKQTVVCSHGWYGMLLPQQYIYIYIHVCVCACVCACVMKTPAGGFPFSHWCIKTCPINPLSCGAGVMFFKNHPAKIQSKTHRSSCLISVSLGSSKNLSSIHQREASPSHTGVSKLVPSTPSLAEQVLCFSKITLQKSNQKLTDLHV